MTQITCIHIDWEQADTWFTNLFSGVPSATFLLGDLCACDAASGAMTFGVDILMYDNHLLRTFALTFLFQGIKYEDVFQ